MREIKVLKIKKECPFKKKKKEKKILSLFSFFLPSIDSYRDKSKNYSREIAN